MPVLLGRFEIHSKLSEGGMAEVLLGRDSKVKGGGPLVVKRLLPTLAKSSFVRMFEEEARICLNLRHPNIVQVYELGEADGLPYLTMEYLNGPTAWALFRRQVEMGTLDYVRACRMLAMVAEGLHYCHDALDADGKPMNLVHRDVTPGNILVTIDGAVKLLDFGVARVDSDWAKTTTEQAKGKAPYMAPEQVGGLLLDHRVDVYALGVCLYQLCTGQLPFQAADDHLVYELVLKGEYPSPTSVRPNLPVELEAIIRKALAKSPDDRYRTAAELARALREVAAAAPEADAAEMKRWVKSLYPSWEHLQAKRIAEGRGWTSQVVTVAATSEVRAIGASPLARTLGAVAVLGLLGTVGWVLFHPKPPPPPPVEPPKPLVEPKKPGPEEVLQQYLDEAEALVREGKPDVAQEVLGHGDDIVGGTDAQNKRLKELKRAADIAVDLVEAQRLFRDRQSDAAAAKLKVVLGKDPANKTAQELLEDLAPDPVKTNGKLPPGKVTVWSSPPAALLVDGVPHGSTPSAELALPPGPHTIELLKQGFSPLKISVRVLPRKKAQFRFTLHAEKPVKGK